MKTALAIFVIVAALFLLLAALWSVLDGPVKRAWAKHQRRHDEKTPWELDEDPVGQTIQVQLVRPGEDPLLIGDPIPVNLPHWEYTERMEEARAEAEDKQAVLNRRLNR